MSDAAFADDAGAEDQELDEALDLEAPEDQEQEEGEADAPEKNWRKIAEDKDGALASERTKRRAADRRARELEDRLMRLETGTGASKGATRAEEDALEQIVSRLRDDDDDPIGDIGGLKAVIRKFVEDQRSSAQADQEVQQQQEQVRQIQRQMSESETDFAEDHPDYHEAAKFFRAQRQEELEDIGYAGQDLQRELSKTLFGIVTRAMQSGRDPAEAVYNLANKRGFNSKDVAKKLETITSAQRAGRGATQSRGPSGGLTPSAVAALKGASFDAAFAKLRSQERRSA